MSELSKPTDLYTLTTGRSGTVFLWQVLQASKGISAHHELRPMPDGPARSMARRGFRADLPDVLGLPQREALRRQAQRKGTIHAETGWQLTFFAPRILEALGGEVRFIHLVRDPRTWTSSWLRVLESYDHPGRMFNVMPLEDPMAEWYYSQPRPARSLWWWQTLNGWVMDFLKALPEEQYRLVRMEELTLPVARELYGWLGKPFFLRPQLERALIRHWNDKPELGPNEEWDPEWNQWLPREMMAELGYE